jgi:hypothetical protein
MRIALSEGAKALEREELRERALVNNPDVRHPQYEAGFKAGMEFEFAHKLLGSPDRRAPEPAGREDGGWIDVRTDTPPEDVPVWCLTKGDGIFIGGYVYIDEGWVWTNCYTSIYHTLKDGEWKWEANDFEYDDEYEVIAWQHLPSPPNDNLLRRLSRREG